MSGCACRRGRLLLGMQVAGKWKVRRVGLTCEVVLVKVLATSLTKTNT